MNLLAPADAPSSAESLKPRAGLHYGYVLLLTSVLVVTGALGLGRFAYTLILPSMQSGLRLSNAEMGLIASGNYLGYAISALVSGMLATRFGPRLVISLGLALEGAMMFLTGMAQGFPSAALARSLTGIGSAGANVCILSLASPWVAPRRRGLATGVVVAGSSVGLLVTGAFVPGLNALSADGWRLSWYALGGIVLALAVIAVLVLRNHPREKGLRPLWSEADTSATALDAANGKAPGLGAVWRNGLIWRIGLVFAAYGFAYLVYATFFATHVQRSGLSPQAAGDLWALVGLLSLGSGILWGSISDRLGRRWALVVVYLIQAAALLCMVVGTGWGYFAASAVLYGLAGWSVPAIMAAAVGDSVDPRLVPAGNGLSILILGLGQVVGPGLAGAIADAAGSFVPSFALASAIAVIGALGSLTLPGKPTHASWTSRASS